MSVSPATAPPRTSALSADISPSCKRARARPPVLDDERAPGVALAEERGAGRARDRVALPGDDVRLDAEVVAERAPLGRRRDQVDDDAHALLLDAERRDLGEAGRLDAAHARRQRLRAAPVVDEGGHARTHAHRLDGEQVGGDLEHARIADLDERRAGGDDALALLHHAQHLARHRRHDLELVDATGAAALQGGARLGELMVGDLGAELGRRQVLRARGRLALGHLEVVRGDGARRRQLALARQIVARAAVGDAGARHRRRWTAPPPPRRRAGAPPARRARAYRAAARRPAPGAPAPRPRRRGRPPCARCAGACRPAAPRRRSAA